MAARHHAPNHHPGGSFKNGADDLPCDNPIGTRLSPIYPVQSVTYVSGPDRLWLGSGGPLQPIRPTENIMFFRLVG